MRLTIAAQWRSRSFPHTVGCQPLTIFRLRVATELAAGCATGSCRQLSNQRKFLDRSAQMSLSLNGAFWPTILPLFHGSRKVGLAAVRMMVSHRVEGPQRCASSTEGAVPSLTLRKQALGGPPAFRRVDDLAVSAMSGHLRRAALR